MPRGCQNKRAAKSEAAWAAKKNPKCNGKPKAHPTTIKDERPTQLIPPKRIEIAPEWAKLKKKDHDNIPGTRVQCIPGGIAVRVILQDGKKFPPHKVLAAKRHLRRLAEQAREKDEISKMINSKQVVSYGAANVDPIDSVDVPASKQLRAPTSPTSSTSAERGSKRARKEAAWKERQQKLAERHAAKILEEGRELVSELWYEGEVVQRAEGKAWVKLCDPAQLPEKIMPQLRNAAAEIKSQLPAIQGELLPVCFADVIDLSLDMKPGVRLQFKVFTGKHGVGGCDAKADSASENQEKEACEKRRKTSAESADKATKEKTKLAA